ncbi:unnamed protein product [Paramecium sonneborni]|uniref:Uncharacterized protein n=1 Tax=Paramecium sonneborni TaxID=65129 RepID=A0A8S1PUP4_9CILI|nr:unnamed protein product [Paramecium sonneborni]CAD8107044.1 unnamed protein product [Paramecium sonneborni]
MVLQYYLFKRNIAFFINYTQLRIVKLQTFVNITLIKEKFLQLIFMLARNKSLHLAQSNSALNSFKNDQFDQELWGRFIDSKEILFYFLSLLKITHNYQK